MNKAEVGVLLLLASGLDRFVQVDQVTTDAWYKVLSAHNVTYAQAEQACIDHYTGPDGGRPFTVAHVIAAVAVSDRTAQNAIEADVRSAKARGLIEKSWPERDMLPDDVRDALFTLRDMERRTAAERFEFDQLPEKPIETGEVRKAVA